MDELFVRAYSAYATGVACSAGVVALVKALPLEDYIRRPLQMVLPVPPALIALVMMTYGPHAVDTSGSGGSLSIEAFLVGISAGPLAAATMLVIDSVKRRIQDKVLARVKGI